LGWIFVSMFLFFLVALALGHPLATSLGGVAIIFGYLFWGPQVLNMVPSSIFGTMGNYILVCIPLFIFMANLLSESGIAEELFDSLRKIMGRTRGGIGIAVIIVCTVFAACTGIIGASIVTMGLLAVPVMLRYGYDKKLTAGIITAGGSLGILIPPSIMLVIMGDQATLSVGKLFAAAIIPGLILATLYIVYVIVISNLHPELAPTISEEELKGIPKSAIIRQAFKSLVPPSLLILGVLGSIFTGIATPTEAAGVGAAIAFILIIVYKKFSWKVMTKIVKETALTTGMVMIILAVAAIFTATFLAMGGGEFVSGVLLGTGLNKWFILGIMLFIIFILGMFIDWTGIVLMCFPIFLPVVVKLGFDRLWFVGLFAVILQTSFLTPPFGYAIFFLKGISDEIELMDIYRGIMPFIILMLICVVLIIAFPQLILWLPSFVK
jgi:tripartite ATP-independent transporter DctM subunit